MLIWVFFFTGFYKVLECRLIPDLIILHPIRYHIKITCINQRNGSDPRALTLTGNFDIDFYRSRPNVKT